jgi:hypothetical protein
VGLACKTWQGCIQRGGGRTGISPLQLEFPHPYYACGWYGGAYTIIHYRPLENNYLLVYAWQHRIYTHVQSKSSARFPPSRKRSCVQPCMVCVHNSKCTCVSALMFVLFIILFCILHTCRSKQLSLLCGEAAVIPVLLLPSLNFMLFVQEVLLEIKEQI